MPWRARTDVGLPLLALALVAAVVVSCVSVTTRAVTPVTSPPVSDAAGATPRAEARNLGPSLEPEPTKAPRSPAVEPQPSAPPDTRIDIAATTSTAPPTRPPTTRPPPTERPSTQALTQVPIPSPSAKPSATVAPTIAPSASPVPSASSEASAAAGAVGTGERTVPGLDRATVRKIERILARTTGKRRVAGLQVAVRLAGGETWLGTSGNAEYAPDRPIEDDTVFAIASVSKTFIAALILQLAEEGKLDLDAPYGRYVHQGPRRERVTVRQLLSHTSGIYDYFASPRYIRSSTAWLRTRPQPGLLAREHEWTYDEIMGLVRPVRYCRPGACYRYSNTNYVLLGQVAEAVGEASLHRLLRRRFFRPLGLDDTYYQPAEQPPASAAHGHWPAGTRFTDHTRDDPLRPFTAAVTAAGAAGAIASTARDLSIWADALYGGKILSRASLAQMMAIQPDGSYGLGTDYGVFAGHAAFGHRGGLRGFEASMWYFPGEGVSAVILSNQGNWFTSRAGSIDVPMKGIVRAVLGRRR